MNLTDYIKSSGGTATIDCPVLAAFASDCECSHRTLYMIARGHKQAGPLLAGRIEKATHSAVSRYELRPDVFGEQEEGSPPLRRSTAAREGNLAADPDATTDATTPAPCRRLPEPTRPVQPAPDAAADQPLSEAA